MLYILINITEDSMHSSMVNGRKKFVAETFPQVINFCSLDRTLSGGWYFPEAPGDYDYIDWKTGTISDLTYLKKVQAQYKNSKILGVIKSPDEQQIANEATHELLGFDILDYLGHYSLLTNCGGFPELFENSELNQYALLDEFKRVYSIKDYIKKNYSDDPHCRACEVWAVFNINKLI